MPCRTIRMTGASSASSTATSVLSKRQQKAQRENKRRSEIRGRSQIREGTQIPDPESKGHRSQIRRGTQIPDPSRRRHHHPDHHHLPNLWTTAAYPPPLPEQQVHQLQAGLQVDRAHVTLEETEGSVNQRSARVQYLEDPSQQTAQPTFRGESTQINNATTLCTPWPPAGGKCRGTQARRGPDGSEAATYPTTPPAKPTWKCR